MWPAWHCVLQQGVSPSPGWHDLRWQGTQLDNRPTVGRLQVPQRVATNYQPRHIKHKQKKVDKTKAQTKQKARQNENKDHCCPSSGTPWCFSAFRCQPQTENTDTEGAPAFAHLTAEDFIHSRLRTGTARRWGTTWRLWFHNRWDRAFVSESSPVYLQGEKPSPLSGHVFITLDTWIIANLITFSYLTGLWKTLNGHRDRGTFMLGSIWHGAKLSAVRNGPHVARMGYTLHSTGSLTKTRLNQHMANPSGTKAGLISPKIRDDPGSEQRRHGLLSSCLPNHKGLGCRPRNTELSGQLSEIGQSKV